VDEVSGPCFVPQNEYETFGVEDPRLTRIGDRYTFTYVAVSPHGAATALASTTDFVRFERQGVIFCPENKDVLLFGERIGGRFAAIHRPSPSMRFSPPQMWLAWSCDLVHWGEHQFLFGGGGAWDAARVGGGCPPLRTPRGWLEIYHGSAATAEQGAVGTYGAGAFLMDLSDPARIIARSAGPIMLPEADFETDGFVPNVVFPTGIVERDGTLLVYYGAADTCTGVVGYERDELLASLG
jgi:predicted GH43/DUF377 family glycosyl hydrolase